MRNIVAKYLPVLDWLPRYQKEWLRLDLVAGLTTAAVVIPKAMAYATIAGLPVQMGLYVAFMPMLVYALLGTSHPLSVSSTSTIAILTASQLAMVAPGRSPDGMMAAAATLALLTGLFLALAAMLRLGFLGNFISEPVLTGFKGGIALEIVVDQLPKLLGIHIDKSGFFRDIVAILRHVAESSQITVVLAIVMLALLFGMEYFLPRAPAPLAAVVLGIVAVELFGLKDTGLSLVGRIPSGIPAPALPDLSLVRLFWPGALGIALMSFTESVAAGRAFARSDEPHPQADQELLALGAGNMVGSFFLAFPAGGGTSQTAVNSRAGARTQLASLVTVALVTATMLFLSPLISLLPLAVLAAVVIVTTLPLLNPQPFRAILKVRRTEFCWSLVACAGVVLLGTLPGILVAISISVVTLMYQANHPPLYAVGRKPGTTIYRPLTGQHPGDETIPGLLIVRTEGRMNFASAPRVSERLWSLIREADPTVVILECSAIPDFEYTALLALCSFEEQVRKNGMELWLAALNPEAFRVVERTRLARDLGRERMFINLREAVEAYEKRGQQLMIH